MNEPGHQSLIDQKILDRRVRSGETPAWVRADRESFREGLLGGWGVDGDRSGPST